jgi:hypothetical protein
VNWERGGESNAGTRTEMRTAEDRDGDERGGMPGGREAVVLVPQLGAVLSSSSSSSSSPSSLFRAHCSKQHD